MFYLVSLVGLDGVLDYCLEVAPGMTVSGKFGKLRESESKFALFVFVLGCITVSIRRIAKKKKTFSPIIYLVEVIRMVENEVMSSQS